MNRQAVSTNHSTRLPSLDGLRAVSICMVVICHCSATISSPSHTTLMLLGFAGNGGLGVTIFFVISGFLITTLLGREYLIAQSLHYRNFYLRRAFRIFPAFYAYWLVVVGLELGGIVHLSRSDLLSSASYVWNYCPRSVDTWFLGHTWSLSVEEQFYLLWPLILGFATPRRAKWVAGAVIIAEPFIRVSTYVLLPWSRPLIGMMVHTRADSLMIGALLALVSLDGDHRNLVKRIASVPLIPISGLCFVVVDTLLTRSFAGKYLLPIGYSAQNVAIAVFLAYVVYREDTKIARILNQAVVVHLGLISYSLYIWQQLFLTPKNTTMTGRFPLNIVCALVVAELSYFFLEKPFLRWRRRFSQDTKHEDINPAGAGAVVSTEAAVAASASA